MTTPRGRTELLSVRDTDSIEHTLRVIDNGALGIALVIADGGRLLGTATDGDVRRAILRGTALGELVRVVMHRDPVTVGPGAGMQEVRQLFLQSGVKHIPVIDEHGVVLDVLTLTDLISSVPLSNPDVTDSEIEAVLDVLRTPHLSLGPKLVEFEAKVAEYAQRKFAIAVNSGTSGLHLIVRALGLSDGDEVITTPFSFIASSNCLLYERAIPVFVDIDPDTYNLRAANIEAAISPRTRAILVVDVFGQPADYAEIGAIAERHGLALITDCCESIGAEYHGRRSSTYGEAGVFAFYPNKQITTGEGGVIFTDDAEVARACRSMRNQGRSESGRWLAHERLGFNYRLSEINCALGIGQLDRIDEILASRQQVADVYTELLSNVPGVKVPYVDPSCTRMSWFVYVVRLTDERSREDRDAILQRLTQNGIGVSNYFPPIHLQPFYRDQFGFAEGDFPITERVSSLTLALPFHNRLTPDECKRVASQLDSALTERKLVT